MSDRRVIFHNISSLAVVRGLEYLVPVILLPYMVRVLGLEGFGLVNFSLAFALYFSAFMQYGFALTSVKKIARARDNKSEIEYIYSQTMSAIFFLIFVCAIIYFPIIYFFDKFREYFLLHTFSFFFIASQALFPTWFFQGMENMKQSAIISMVSRVVLLLLTLIMIRSPDDYFMVPAINAVSMVMCFLFSIFWISRKWKIRYKIVGFDDILNVLKEGRHAFFAQMAPNLYINSSTFLLGIFSNPVAVGAFSAAAKSIDLFNSFGMIISSAFYPFLARKPEFIEKFQKFMLASGLFLTIFCFVFAELIVILLFSNQNLVIVEYIRYSAIGILAFFAMRAYYDNGLMLKDRDDLAGRMALLVSLLFFILGIIFIPLYGVIGAVLTLTGARCCMALGWYSMYIKNKK